MEVNLLNAASGDAIARDWELPELPSGNASLPSSTSLPTSQELAEIFGTSDDEDEDFPFPLSSDLQMANLGGVETKQFSDVSQFATVIGEDSSLFLGSLGDTLPMDEQEDKLGVTGRKKGESERGDRVREGRGDSGTSEGDVEMDTASGADSNDGNLAKTTPEVSVRKSSRLSSLHLKKEEVKPTRPPPSKPQETKTSSTESEQLKDKVLPTEEIKKEGVKHDPVKQEEPAAEEKEEKREEEVEEDREGAAEVGEQEDDSEEEGSSVSDDPERLWCICRKPHNDRFMICCDQCEEWFHGDCVGITVSMGKRMERAGKDYVCPVCIERGKLEKEERAANRLARQAKREEFRETKLRELKRKFSPDKQTSPKEAYPHRKRTASSSHSGGGTAGSGDQYGLKLLFQPDNAPHRSSPSSSTATPVKEQQEGGERRRRSFSRSFYMKQEEVPVATPCLAPGCSAQATPPSRYCSEPCIEKYTTETLKKLASRGITFEMSPSEFVRGSKGVSMVDKVTGKTVIGIQAPTDKTLASWIKQHPSYEVLLPTGKSGKGSYNPGKPGRIKLEEGAEGKRGGGGGEKREGDSPTKQRSLNDPGTVRMNAKKALLQTLWRRKEAVDDVIVTQDQVEKIANHIEEELHDLHGDINTKYKTKYRSLLFNLKDMKNQGLFRKVCLGQISPPELVRMKSEQFASDELAEWREKTLKKDLDKIVEREEDARSNPTAIRKITYKGEEEIEAEKTEAIETIAPSEEQPLTPTTPVNPVSKQAVQSQDGAKASDDGTRTVGKQDSQSKDEAKPTSASKRDGQKSKHVKKEKDQHKSKLSHKASKSDLNPKSETKTASSEAEKKEAEKPQSGGLLDLLTDTTSEHDSHIYHPHCQICLGKKRPCSPPPSESTKDAEEQQSAMEFEEVDDMQTESYYHSSLPPPLPLIWDGFIDMPGTTTFSSVAYPVSGNAEYVTEVLPSTLHVMGRIAHVQVWDYIDKLQSSNTREIVILRFDWAEDDRDAYESLLNYLVRKHRCGVVDEQLHGVKDFYLVPLMVDQDIPINLLPFSGPGLPDDRPDLLLGIIVQTKGIKPSDSQEATAVPEPPLASTLSGSAPSSSSAPLKRHWSTSSDDQATDAAKPKRMCRQVMVGFGGQTPPLSDDGDDEKDVEPMDVTSQQSLEKKAERLQMSFYGKHAEFQDKNRVATSSSKTVTQSSGIKSILSQLSDEKLKELASAMSNIEESSSSPPASSETSPSTVKSPATGQMIMSVSSGAHPHQPPLAPVQLSGPSNRAPPGTSKFHQSNFSQLQRTPLHPSNRSSSDESGSIQQHDRTTHGPPNYRGPGQLHSSSHLHQPQRNYPSPQGNEQQFNRGPPQSSYSREAPFQQASTQQQPPPHAEGQHYQSQPNAPPGAYNTGGPAPRHPGPPHQYSGPHHHSSSPQQYSGSPHGGGPPNKYTGPPSQHQGSPQQYSGPPSQHTGGPPPQHSGPPHQYSHTPSQHQGPPPQHTGGPPNQLSQHPTRHPQQYSSPPHQYSGPPQEHSGPPPQQNSGPYPSTNNEHHPHPQQQHYPNQRGDNPGYPDNQGYAEWSHESGTQSYQQQHHQQYYEGDSRVESHDYGHQSRPPNHDWKPDHSGHGWNKRHEFRGRGRGRGRR